MQKQLTATSAMPQALQKISQSVMVQKLINRDFAGFHSCVPKTLKECYESAVPMVTVNHLTSVLPQIEFELNLAVQSLNVDERLTLQKHQVPVIAQMIYDEWKTLSLEDVALAMKRGVNGFYGRVFRLDGATITDWLSKYSEERSFLQDTTHMNEKKEFAEVNYDAFKKRLDEERKKQTEQEAADRETRIQLFQARNGGRQAFTVTTDWGVMENVYADSQKGADAIVAKLISDGNLEEKDFIKP